jgi:protoporphyrinogen oxidase
VSVTTEQASRRTAVIIGAGPAGLTAAYELLQRTDVTPIVLEKSEYMGGISRTVNYKGNRIDIGGHRFFSKSDRVMEWWLSILPMQGAGGRDVEIAYRSKRATVAGDPAGPDPAATDRVMLVRSRKSRIYFLRRFFDYPIRLSRDTLGKLGVARTIRIGVSYVRSALFPIRRETSLEDFFINRFGRELYRTFFRDYTEKVWGVPCREISAEWGAQRVKGLSVLKTLQHAVRGVFRTGADVSQKTTETSLIERFLYPKLGPGQMWEEVATLVRARGGEIHTGTDVQGIRLEGNRVAAVTARGPDGCARELRGDFFFSTMPVKELIRAIGPGVPPSVAAVSEGLVYRDFITVGLLLTGLRVAEDRPEGRQLIRDNWVYVQEPDVRVGRMQVFNNWSPYMVADPGTVWIGLEYFCYESDDLWSKPDAEMIRLAVEELARIDIIDPGAVLDATVIRMPKTYPAYFGTYDRFDEIRAWVDRVENLFLVGRNGMHKYNNQDHSMLTAMVAVDNIVAGRTDKANLWAVNAEQDYHESK